MYVFNLPKFIDTCLTRIKANPGSVYFESNIVLLQELEQAILKANKPT